MVDTLSTEERSRLMSRIRGKDTKPERVVRKLLHSMGYRFRLHRKDLPGTPDIVLPKHQKVIFVHGCFWHQHPNCTRASIPKTRTDFWAAKLSKNATRDMEAIAELEGLGWFVMIVWECELRDLEKLTLALHNFLKNNNK